MKIKINSISWSSRKTGYVDICIEDDRKNTMSVERRVYGNTFLLGGYRVYFDSNMEVTKMKKYKQYQSSNKHQYDDIEVIVEEKQQELTASDNKEVRHDKYNDIKMCLENNIPVYLSGPAGSGKNHTVEQIAKELGWNFYFSNSVQQEYKITGFVDAGGSFHSTEFYKACTDENDCIFFLDEMDASIPEVLILLNAAIANGYFEFPNGRVNLEHVHFVAAGNTVGSGADEMYVGRMVLDQATLDRFAIIEFDYCESIEMLITNDNKELVEFIRGLRNSAKTQGIRATFSYRCMAMVTKLEKSGMDLKTIITIAVVKGMDRDTVNTLRTFGTSKYDEALESIRGAA